MEKDKYYTPTIEEFHLGFEFEQKERFGDGTVKTKEDFDNAKWISRIMELGESPYIERMISGRNALNGICGIRVKYLDREDIESFGFKIAGGYSGIINFELSTGTAEINTKENQWKLKFTESSNKIIIEQYRWMRFYGTIKNKSELKKLLVQLGIK